MPYAENNNGMKIYFEEKGEGTPLILTHSFFCSTKMWAPQFQELSKSFRVINVDNRGHGQSCEIVNPCSLYDMVDDNIAVLDALGIEKAVWGGLSIGGMISMRGCLKHPERVTGLILADTDAGSASVSSKFKYIILATIAKQLINNVDALFGIPKNFFFSTVVNAMFGKTTRKQNKTLVEIWKGEFIKAHLSSMLKVLLNTLNERDSVLERLPEIKVPTLIFVGEEDVALSQDKSEKIHRGIDGSKLVVIPECGHLSSLEKPNEVNRIMNDFLATLPCALDDSNSR